MTEGTQAPEMSFLRRGGEALLQRYREELRHLEGARRRATAPWHRKDPFEVFWASDQDASWTQLSESPGEGPEPVGGITYPGWPGASRDPPGGAGKLC